MEERRPDRLRGPIRPLPSHASRLADRAAETDREARFLDRWEAVSAAHERAARRRRWVEFGLAAAAVVVLASIGWGLVGPPGLALGLLGAALPPLSGRAVHRAARRRGAEAWDWQAQRYRLLGRPAERVQALDRPPDQRRE